jgi:hypothetical protein
LSSLNNSNYCAIFKLNTFFIIAFTVLFKGDD